MNRVVFGLLAIGNVKEQVDSLIISKWRLFDAIRLHGHPNAGVESKQQVRRVIHACLMDCGGNTGKKERTCNETLGRNREESNGANLTGPALPRAGKMGAINGATA